MLSASLAEIKFKKQRQNFIRIIKTPGACPAPNFNQNRQPYFILI